MKAWLWRRLAHSLARPKVALWLWRRASMRPYTHIVKDGDPYMSRYWVFNPYPADEAERASQSWLSKKLPSARIHVIHRPDRDRHMHSHPWDARTILLQGSYTEERLVGGSGGIEVTITRHLQAGDTATLTPTDYHRILELDNGGPVTTLFITWEYAAKWGFLVNGKHVYWKDYLGINQPKE